MTHQPGSRVMMKARTAPSSFPTLKHTAERRAGEAEGFTKLIHEIALIGKMYPLRTIRKDDKGRRLCPHLGCIIKFDPPSLKKRGVVGSSGLRENPVQFGSGYPLGVLFHDGVHFLDDPADTLAGLCR